MESKDKLKEIDIKNCTCYYFDDIIKDVDINLSDTLLGEKLCENISVYDISYKTSTTRKPMCIRFHKIDGFIRAPAGEFRYFALFHYGLFDKTFDKIKYLIIEKSGIKSISIKS